MAFIKSASTFCDLIIDNIPEVCLIGRSNVGKSSIVNAICKQAIAKVSSKPGYTQLINYYDCEKFRLVDLPGYGYANVSKSKQNFLVNLVEMYLQKAKNLKAIFQVCDINVITDLDRQMAAFFQKQQINHYIVLNKVDKQSGNYKNQIHKILNFFSVEESKIIIISAIKKTNIDFLVNKMIEASRLKG